MMVMSKYWQGRFEQLQKAQMDKADVANIHVFDAYMQAMKSIEKDLSTWYKRYMKNNNVSYAAAKRDLTAKERKEFLWDVETYIKYAEDNAFNGEYVKELENASIRVHISRLQALQLQLQHHIQTVYELQHKTVTDLIRRIYRDGTYKTAYELQRGLKMIEPFQKIDEGTIETIIKHPWTSDGVNFSSRIWKNKEMVINTMQKELTHSLIRGEHPEKAIPRLLNKIDVDAKKARRLLLTESAYFSTEAERQSFKKLNVKQYEICATLDLKTSEICSHMDGKVFELDDLKQGINAPPFHPHCRSCIVPYFEDFAEDETRIARDGHGQNIQVKGDLTYEKWYNKYVKSTETPTGKGTHEYNSNGAIIPTIEVDRDVRYSPKSRYGPNEVIKYYSANGSDGRMANIVLCDENGFPYKRIHYGYHGNKKEHNFGSKEKPFYNHTHDVLYKNGKPIHGDAKPMTEEELKLLNE